MRINDDWYSWKGWVFDKTQAPHGPMLFEMTHFTDVCNWFLAEEPVEVTAVETGMLNLAVIVRYRSGALATIVIGSNGTMGYCKELYEFMGNGGYLGIDHMLEVRTAGIEDAPARKTCPMVHDRHPQIGMEGGVSGWLAKKRAACAEAADCTRSTTAVHCRTRQRAMPMRSSVLWIRYWATGPRCAAWMPQCWQRAWRSPRSVCPGAQARARLPRLAMTRNERPSDECRSRFRRVVLRKRTR